MQKKTFKAIDFYRSNRLAYQLQFLPLLYGKKEDGVLVTHFPPEEYLKNLYHQGFKNLPKMHLFSELKDLKYDNIDSWGGSITIKELAQRYNISYAIPEISCLKQACSKEFSFRNCPRLPGSKILSSKADAENLIKTSALPRVLKTFFGFAGRGNRIIQAPSDLKWKMGETYICEPWKKRLLDFSTQWNIHNKISFLGTTINHVTDKGFHIGNSVGSLKNLFGPHLPFLKEHKKIANEILCKLKEIGYFGPVGIDAMIYEGPSLHPILEINPRKTMGLVALLLQKHFYRVPKITLSYAKSAKPGLLPSFLEIEGQKKISFSQQLWMSGIVECKLE
ncbi:MAG: hypothetical protein KAR79_01505 [Simkaniaceae bacterium]|nr:hypothetical protein [Simkaniaceae bacterium]